MLWQALTSEVLRSIREKEVRIDIEIKKALEQNNDLAGKGASEMQAVHRRTIECGKKHEKTGQENLTTVRAPGSCGPKSRLG